MPNDSEHKLQSIPEERSEPPSQHPAGPHARPELTDTDKTPGCGVLPGPDDPNISPTG
jgi:hypothetical protein